MVAAGSAATLPVKPGEVFAEPVFAEPEFAEPGPARVADTVGAAAAGGAANPGAGVTDRDGVTEVPVLEGGLGGAAMNADAVDPAAGVFAPAIWPAFSELVEDWVAGEPGRETGAETGLETGAGLGCAAATAGCVTASP